MANHLTQPAEEGGKVRGDNEYRSGGSVQAVSVSSPTKDDGTPYHSVEPFGEGESPSVEQIEAQRGRPSKPAADVRNTEEFVGHAARQEALKGAAKRSR